MKGHIFLSSMLLFLTFLIATCAWPTDVPFWPKYPTRNIQVLDGQWEFSFTTAIPDATHINPNSYPPTENVTVPSCFDVEAPGIPGRRGTALYRTKIDIPANSPVLFYFAACSFYCSVYVDGVNIGEHRAGGYQPFLLTANPSPKTQRELLVVSDNRWNKTTAPTYTGGDFYFYGGLTRSVLVHVQPGPTYILRVESFTVDVNAGLIDVRIIFGGASITGALISLAWDESPAGTPKQYTVANNEIFLKSISVPNPKPWSPLTPNLHTLLVSYLSTATSPPIDAIHIRFGLRIVSILSTLPEFPEKNSKNIQIPNAQPRLAINGMALKLTGVNRHTMWPSTGSSLTLAQVTTDVAVLKSVGANYVRGAHYPQDQRFLDLCDENGIVIWEETLGPGVSVSDLVNPDWIAVQVTAVNEMISASINHPSVIFHGFYNEGPSNNAKACPGYAASAKAIRNRVGDPPTRLVTWASNQATNDVCLDYVDVISFNGYPAWYGHEGDTSFIKPYWQSQLSWVTTHHPTKPFFISETGAGGVWEWTNTTHPYWSQNYQSDVVGIEAEFAVSDSGVSGITIWQFGDIKGDDSATKNCGQCKYFPHPPSLDVPWNCSFIDVKCGRPGGENHKGIVDFWRREKVAFTTLKNIYKKERESERERYERR